MTKPKLDKNISDEFDKWFKENIEDRYSNIQKRRIKQFLAEKLAQKRTDILKKVREEIGKMKKGRKAITGNWEHLLPNSKQYNQTLQDILNKIK